MKIIMVSQRVETVSKYGERQDAIDQQWIRFLLECDLLPVLVPNNLLATDLMLQSFSISGILLTGGNDLCEYGGDSPERDQTEQKLLDYALDKNIPLIGVCRGMQIIQNYFNIQLSRIEGHIAHSQTIMANERQTKVNSFHNWGTSCTIPSFKVWAKSSDGIIKAISHEKGFVHGIMWHPERFEIFREEDRNFFINIFSK